MESKEKKKGHEEPSGKTGIEMGLDQQKYSQLGLQGTDMG